MRQPEHARLQIAITEWIKSEGGNFGAALQNRSIQIDANTILTVDAVSCRMATAAMLLFDSMADAVGVSV